jgi:DNA-binding NarL/FixJ family response regulator
MTHSLKFGPSRVMAGFQDQTNVTGSMFLNGSGPSYIPPALSPPAYALPAYAPPAHATPLRQRDPSGAPIMVAVFDCSPLVAEGLARILESVSGMVVVGVAVTPDALGLLLRQVHCDVLVADEASCDALGPWDLRDVVSHARGLRVLKLVGDDRGTESFSNGARSNGIAANGSIDPSARRNVGVRTELSRRTTPSELIRAIRGLADRGETWKEVGAPIAAATPEVAAPVGETEDRTISQLSPRELEVLRLVSDGFRAREIGDALNISHKTAATHKLRVMRKLGLDRHSDLVRFALRNGLGGGRVEAMEEGR